MHLVASVCLTDCLLSLFQLNYPQISSKEYHYQSMEVVCVSVIRGAYTDYDTNMDAVNRLLNWFRLCGTCAFSQNTGERVN